MAIVDRKWSALPVPHAMEFPDRARKERYFDPDFYQMEVATTRSWTGTGLREAGRRHRRLK